MVRKHIINILLVKMLLTGFVIILSTVNSKAQLPKYPPVDSIYQEYRDIGLAGKLDFEIFERAIGGLEEYGFKKTNLLTIIDFSKASHEERLFVVNLENEKLLCHSLVAHGRNSGVHYAKQFSNTSRSLMSSPGFYSTAETYFGKHGYSLRLDGLEAGINDHARKRAIVMHGANYVSNQFIETYGRIGRSWGCPALPPELTEEVIDIIKDGSCLYIHTDDESYLQDSEL